MFRLPRMQAMRQKVETLQADLSRRQESYIRRERAFNMRIEELEEEVGSLKVKIKDSAQGVRGSCGLCVFGGIGGIVQGMVWMLHVLVRAESHVEFSSLLTSAMGAELSHMGGPLRHHRGIYVSILTGASQPCLKEDDEKCAIGVAASPCIRIAFFHHTSIVVAKEPGVEG